jgi:hypothetical protein
MLSQGGKDYQILKLAYYFHLVRNLKCVEFYLQIPYYNFKLWITATRITGAVP